MAITVSGSNPVLVTVESTTARVLYHRATGDLLYDADGRGGTAPIQFAKLSAGLALTSADFFVI